MRLPKDLSGTVSYPTAVQKKRKWGCDGHRVNPNFQFLDTYYKLLYSYRTLLYYGYIFFVMYLYLFGTVSLRTLEASIYPIFFKFVLISVTSYGSNDFHYVANISGDWSEGFNCRIEY